MHLQCAHTSHLQHLRSDPHLESGLGFLCGNSQCVKAVDFFPGGAMSLMFGRILKSFSEEKVCITEVNSPCLLILLFHTKHKTIGWYLGLTPGLHFREGELIHWVGTAKNHVTNSWVATHKNWVVRFFPHAPGF